MKALTISGTRFGKLWKKQIEHRRCTILHSPRLLQPEILIDESVEKATFGTNSYVLSHSVSWLSGFELLRFKCPRKSACLRTRSNGCRTGATRRRRRPGSIEIGRKCRRCRSCDGICSVGNLSFCGKHW